MTFSEILKDIQGKIEENNLYRITLSGRSIHKMEIERFLRETLSAFYFEIINEIVEDSFHDLEIKDKYISDVLHTFSDSKLEGDAMEMSKNYILEQYYDI